jgi:hypothetical protein
MEDQKYHPPFRVGKKQSRAVLDSKGIEVVVFPKGNEMFAQILVDRLNELYSIFKI